MKKWFRTPLHPRAKVAQGVVTADKVSLIQFDAVWAGQNRRWLIERWWEITAQ